MGRGRQKECNRIETSAVDDAIIKKVIAKDYQGLKAAISQGKSLNNKDLEGRLPLEVALINMDFTATNLLIEGGADVNATNKLGLTFFHIIIRQIAEYVTSEVSQDEIFSIIRKIADAGGKLGAQERRGNTPINSISQLAKANKPLTEVYTRTAKLLLTLDKDVSDTIQVKNNMGKAPMDYLARNGNIILRETIYEKLPAVRNRLMEEFKKKDLAIKKLLMLDKELANS